MNTFLLQKRTLSFLVLALLFLSYNVQASVTIIKSSLLNISGSSGLFDTPIFTNRNQTIRVTGRFVDLCKSTIDIEDLNGSVRFTVPKGASQGGDGSWVEFSFNQVAALGRYRARLKSMFANDLIQLEFLPCPSVSNIQVLTPAGGIAFENAFAVGADFTIRVTGVALHHVKFYSEHGISIVFETGPGSTSTLKNISVRGASKIDKMSLNKNSIMIGGTGFNVTQVIGVNEFASPPFYRIYDKPNLRVVRNFVTGIYNRTSRNPCPAISSNSAIQSPSRCDGIFAVPNPTVGVPLVEKIVTMPSIQFKIWNDSYAQILTPFIIQVKFGLTVLGTFTVPRMIAQQEYTITYNRPEQSKKLARHLTCSECYEVLVAPYNWTDPDYTLIIDPLNAVAESNEGDNSQFFQGTRTLAN